MKYTKSNSVSSEDKWAAKSARLEELSADQARADIELVQAQRDAERAQSRLELALSRRTTAEKKLSAFRATLGAE